MPILTAVVEQCLAPVPGGTGRYAAELTRAMADSAPTGWRVRTVIAWHRDVGAARLPPASGPHRLPAGRRMLTQLWARGLPPWPGGDSVHATTPLMPRRRTRLVVTVHDAVPWTHPETLTPRGVRWHRRMIARAADDADFVVVPTTTVADQLRALFPLGDRIQVIPHGVAALPVPPDEATRRIGLGLPPDYLLTLSTLEPRKGLDVAIAALARPALAGRHLVVVGPAGWGGVDPDIAAAAAGVDPDRLHVLGRVPDEVLAAVLAGAGVLLVPSRAEGFGLPVLEGMAAGVPVVHSAAPALVEVAGAAGVEVGIGDPDALAEAAGAILADEALAARLRSSGRTRAAEFSWAETARRTWELHTG